MAGDARHSYHSARQALGNRGGDSTGADPQTAVDALALVHEVLADAMASLPAGDVLAALTVLRHVREEIAEWEPRLIEAARACGVSWAELAPALGVTSRQAAERRYLRLRPSETGETTAEARVQAERDRRAADRAVAQWARENSAALRALAGQLGALEDLPPRARPHAREVHLALAENDATLLLGPLTEALRHLTASHAPLAAQIQVVVSRATTLRHDTHNRRQAR